MAVVPSQITTLSQLSYNYQEGLVNLAWSPPVSNGSPVLFYTLMKDAGAGVFYPIYQGSALQYTDSNLVAGASYNYQVYATNGAGSGPVSPVATGIAGALPG